MEFHMIEYPEHHIGYRRAYDPHKEIKTDRCQNQKRDIDLPENICGRQKNCENESGQYAQCDQARLF